MKLASLPGDLVKYDPGRRTEIQAFNNSEHRNVHAQLAPLQRETAYPDAFVSKPDSQFLIPRVIGFMKDHVLAALGVGRRNDGNEPIFSRCPRQLSVS